MTAPQLRDRSDIKGLLVSLDDDVELALHVRRTDLDVLGHCSDLPIAHLRKILLRNEIPQRAELEAPFGSFRASYEVSGGMLIYERDLEVKAVVVPASDYGIVRKFFSGVAGLEQAPVVFLKK
jgi:hypothetical protein